MSSIDPPEFSRRSAIGLLAAGVATGFAAMALPARAQIQSQKPVIQAPLVIGDPIIVQLPPSNALAILDDGSYVASIDGKQSAIEFRLGSRHIIRGRGLADGVHGWVMGHRTETATAGSLFTIVAGSDTEMTIEITDISGGQSVWRPGANQGVQMILVTNGGGRTFDFAIPQGRYFCVEGEANCAA